ncbi:MAG: hypothetical protein EXR71_14455 [Myxococcales bacterium]|nr:hypothetical protein [Myxococcales bacterium]
MAFLVGCSASAPPTPPTLHFVRGGVLLDGVYTTRPWTPGESVTVGPITAIAPRLAECVEVARVDLGDVSRMTVAGAPAPDTDLAFSPDGALLAVGSFRGEVLVLDVATGVVMARRSLGEAMVRRVAWAADGRTLYAGEQSPDASLRALDPATLADRWRLDLAARVGRSTLPAGEDLYGIYSLPGVYGLDVLAGGDLLVSAAHGWSARDGARLNRSQLLRVRPDGSVLATWPAEPADLVLLHPAVDETGGRVAVPVTRSASTPAPDGYPVGGLQLLELDGLRPVGSVVVPPLLPWFTSTYLWQAHDLDVARDTVLVGLGDGRLVLASQDGTLRTTVAGGSPVLAGDVPVAASIGHGLLADDTAVYLTSGTNIPWGAAAPDLRPPSPHPDESTLFVAGLDGTRRWSFHGAWDVQGLTLAPDGRTLVVGAGERHSDSRRDLYGALIFDLGGPARDGDARLLTTCTTEGPVFFRQAVSATGVVALAEVPYPTGDGGVAGAYRVVLFR